jgi:hypothetical protein
MIKGYSMKEGRNTETIQNQGLVMPLCRFQWYVLATFG